MSKVLTIIGIIVIIAVIAVGGYFAWAYFNPKEYTVEKSETQAQSPEPSSNVQNSNSETADWKTYTNAEYGFEVRYPAYASFSVDSMNAGYFWIDLPARAEAKRKLLIGVQTGPQQTDCSNDNFHFLKNTTPVTLNGITFVKGDVSDYYTGVSTKNYANQYCSKHNGNTYVLTSILEYSHNPSLLKFDLEKDEDINKILSTFKFTDSQNQTLDNNSPKINSINPNSGPKGTIVEIKGINLSGFEGDLDVYFERSDGKKIMLTDNFGDYQKTGGNLIKVKVIEPCQKGEKVIGRYSGIESICEYVELTPGMYKVYVEPWGKKSSVVNFEIK